MQLSLQSAIQRTKSVLQYCRICNTTTLLYTTLYCTLVQLHIVSLIGRLINWLVAMQVIGRSQLHSRDGFRLCWTN